MHSYPFSFCSKSSLLLGLSLTVPLMVACLSFAIPIWIRNGYQFWVSQVQSAATPAGNNRPPGKKEVCYLILASLSSTYVKSAVTDL